MLFVHFVRSSVLDPCVVQVQRKTEKVGNLHSQMYGKQQKKKASLPSEKAHVLNYDML